MGKALITSKNIRHAMPQLGAAIRRQLNTGIDIVVEFKEVKSNRSNAQNRLLWKWNQEIAEHLREHFGQENSSEEVHEVLVRKKCGVKVIQVGEEDPIITRKKTRKMNTAEFSEYLNWLECYSAEYLQLQVTHPADLYYEAMGKS